MVTITHDKLDKGKRHLYGFNSLGDRCTEIYFPVLFLAFAQPWGVTTAQVKDLLSRVRSQIKERIARKEKKQKNFTS